MTRYTYEIRYVGAPHSGRGFEYDLVSKHDSIEDLDAAWRAGCLGNLGYDYTCVVTDGTNEWPMWSDAVPDEAFHDR